MFENTLERFKTLPKWQQYGILGIAAVIVFMFIRSKLTGTGKTGSVSTVGGYAPKVPGVDTQGGSGGVGGIGSGSGGSTGGSSVGPVGATGTGQQTTVANANQ